MLLLLVVPLLMTPPAAGLDSAVTYDIVASLKARAKERGCAYVISLLQPTPETYGLFDEIVLLREGEWWSP